MKLFKKGIGFEAVEGEKRLFLHDLDMKFLKHKVARIDFTDVPILVITNPEAAGQISGLYHKQQRANSFDNQRLMTLVKEGHEQTN